MLNDFLELDKQSISESQLNYWNLLQEIFVRSESGKKLLEYWEKSYLYSPSIPPIDKANHYPEWFPYVREGENRFVRKVLTDLRQYSKYQKEQKDDRSGSSNSGSTDRVTIRK